jgi:hypothetical protein
VEFGASGPAARFRANGEPRDLADGRERFAAKPKRGKPRLQILDIGDLARGVLFDRSRHVFLGHADSVVGNADVVGPAFLGDDANPGSVSIEAVFDKLFHD